MSIKPTIQQIEIGFWNFAIVQMHKSAFLRFVIPRAYRLYRTGEIRRSLKMLLAVALLGLATGVVLGILIQV